MEYNFIVTNPSHILQLLKTDVSLYFSKYDDVQALKIIEVLYTEYHYREYKAFVSAFNNGGIVSSNGDFELVRGQWFTFKQF